MTIVSSLRLRIIRVHRLSSPSPPTHQTTQHTCNGASSVDAPIVLVHYSLRLAYNHSPLLLPVGVDDPCLGHKSPCHNLRFSTYHPKVSTPLTRCQVQDCLCHLEGDRLTPLPLRSSFRPVALAAGSLLYLRPACASSTDTPPHYSHITRRPAVQSNTRAIRGFLHTAMAEYGGETPFPGDYQPGQVDASPGFLHAFEPSAGLPHFSPGESEHSFTNTSGGVNIDRRPTSSSGPAGDMHMSGHPGSAHGRYPGHQHTPSGQSGHSHSFSTASLPSLSSSTGFSIASHPEHPPPGMYVPQGLTPNPEYGAAPSHMFPHDNKPMIGTGGMPTPHPSMALAPGIGLGMGGIGMPPTPLSGTLPPALLGRSPIGPPTMMMPVSLSIRLQLLEHVGRIAGIGHTWTSPSVSYAPGASVMCASLTHQNQGYPPGMGKTPHDRRSVTRPSPYHVQSSRSNSLSLKYVTASLRFGFADTSTGPKMTSSCPCTTLPANPAIRHHGWVLVA